MIEGLEANLAEVLRSPEAHAVLQDRALEQGMPAVLELTQPQFLVLTSTEQITLAIAGIRAGKTHVGAIKMIHYAMEHPTESDEVHLILSPTYPMSRVPIEKMFKLMFDASLFPVNPMIRFSRSNRAFTIVAKDGKVSTILVRSASDPDRLRGLKVLSCWIDEAAYCSAYAWDIVQGRLADVNGPCWITTTPNGMNWVFDLYDRAREGDKRIRVVHWPSTENRFISQEGIEGLTERYDPKTAKQELEAKFVRGRGLIYYPFRRKLHLRPWKFNPALPLYVGQDFNVDPMASVLMQPIVTVDGADGLQVFDAWLDPDSSTYRLCVRLHEFCERHRIPLSKVTIFPDASGSARSTSGKSDFKIIREAGFNISAPAKNPKVKDRINVVNGLLSPYSRTAKRVPRLYITPDCTPVIEALEKQIWAPESDPPVPDKTMGFDHIADALGYPCWRLFPLKTGTVIGVKAQPTNARAVPPQIRRRVVNG